MGEDGGFGAGEGVGMARGELCAAKLGGARGDCVGGGIAVRVGMVRIIGGGGVKEEGYGDVRVERNFEPPFRAGLQGYETGFGNCVGVGIELGWGCEGEAWNGHGDGLL